MSKAREVFKAMCDKHGIHNRWDRDLALIVWQAALATPPAAPAQDKYGNQERCTWPLGDCACYPGRIAREAVAPPQPSPAVGQEPRTMPIPQSLHEANLIIAAILALYPDADTSVPAAACSDCKGSGTITVTPTDRGPDAYPQDVDCPACKGTGSPATAAVGQEPVGDIFRCAITGQPTVMWFNQMPAPGTKLYTRPAPAAVGQADDARDALLREARDMIESLMIPLRGAGRFPEAVGDMCLLRNRIDALLSQRQPPADAPDQKESAHE